MELELGLEQNLEIQGFLNENLGIRNPNTTTPKKRNSYSIGFKRDVLNEIITKENAGCKSPLIRTSESLNVNIKLVEKWSLQRDKILNMNVSESARKVGCGRRPQNADVEDYIVSWVNDKRSMSMAVSVNTMACEIMRVYPSRFNNFKHCQKWTYSILERNELSIRRKTHDQTRLAEHEMGAIHLDFVVHFQRLKDFHDIPFNLIVNMDETGLDFDMTSNTTVNTKGAKHVAVRSTGNPAHCTVFLAVALDGTKLKPLVVFKGKKNGTVSKSLSDLDPRNEYQTQEKGYCDRDMMLFWIQKCLKPVHNTKRPALLMMDNFSAHLISSVRKELSDCGWAQLYLPPNMTSRLQVLDVGINKPFKDYMKAHYNRFMIDNINGKVTRELMGRWIANSWESIPCQFIINTSKNIGFRN